MNESHHYEIAVTVRGGQRVVLICKRIGDLSAEVASAPFAQSVVAFGIDADCYTFSFGPTAAEQTPLATGMMTRYLGSIVARGFTGVYFGMYATGNGQPATAPADFDRFDHEAL